MLLQYLVARNEKVFLPITPTADDQKVIRTSIKHELWFLSLLLLKVLLQQDSIILLNLTTLNDPPLVYNQHLGFTRCCPFHEILLVSLTP